MKKKSVRLVFITLVALALLFGCSKKQESIPSTTDQAKNAGTTTNKQQVAITFLNSKGEIQEGLEQMAEAYEKETGSKVTIVACGAGEVPYTKVTTMYNSGNAPTMAMLDTTDIVALAKEYSLELTDEKWTAECESQLTKIEGKVYSFPFCIEGRGIIFNQDAIEKTLGHSWDPSSCNNYSAFKSLLAELRSKGMKNPVFLAKEDWSLGAHQLGFIYDAYDGTTAGSAKIISQLEGGLDPLSYNRFNQFVDTLDLLMEYNYYKTDPLGANYDEGALRLAEGEVAFWPNGCWAWPNIAEGGASTEGKFGFLPFFLGDDTSDFANNSIEAAPSKQVMIDKKQASLEQVAVAKDFLDWIVYKTTGQQMMVETCAIIPACKNNPFTPKDPLGKDIVKKMAEGKTFSSSFIAPSDHWSAMGAAVQKYIALKSDRNGLAKDLSSYWKKQAK
ncbi:MAG: ABC transporter substrate-binding protein [Sphaerochaetaceae bacterium]